MPSAGAAQAHVEELLGLNSEYIEAVKQCDSRWFDKTLAQDFLCSNPDGSLVDKPAFLLQVAQPPTITGLMVDDVRVRVLDDVAIVHARTNYTTAGGEQKHGRYTDVWQRRDGSWVVVSAHVTR
jgi:ketosteroid isomerase-like protein